MNSSSVEGVDFEDSFPQNDINNWLLLSSALIVNGAGLEK